MGRQSKLKLEKRRAKETTANRQKISEADHKPFARLVHACLLVVVAAAVYANALNNGFVWDDNYQILRNPFLRDASYLPRIFTAAFWDFLNPNQAKTTNFYRPMQSVTYMISYYLFGLKPWGFHAVSVIFHIATTLMAYSIACRLLQNARLALPAGLLFATHPIHTESVTWVAGITDVNCAFFYFLSFHLHLKAGERESFRTGPLRILSLLSFFVALLCKEMALTLPLVLMAYEYCYGNYSISRSDLMRVARKSWPYFLVLLIYIVIRVSVLGFFSTAQNKLQTSLYQNLSLTFIFIFEYVKKLILPINLNAFPMFKLHNSLADVRVLAGITLLTGLALAFYKLRVKDRKLLFFIAWFCITLLPVLNLSAVSVSLFAERYLYIPSFGFCLMLCALAWKLISMKQANTFPYTSHAVNIGLIVVLGFYSMQTISRNSDWKDNITLYSKTLKATPYSAHMHNNLGSEYIAQPNSSDIALREFQEALNALSTDYHQPPGEMYTAYIGIGVSNFQKGRYTEAREAFQKAMEVNPSREWAYSYLAAIQAKDDSRLNEAVSLLHKSLELNPNNEVTHDLLGVVLFNRGEYKAAAREFVEALKIFPDYSDARNHLQLAQGMLEKANNK